MSPSKTPCEIEILKELLHSVAEWLRFIDFGLPNGSQLPPPPGASKMAPEWFPDDSQMTPR